MSLVANPLIRRIKVTDFPVKIRKNKTEEQKTNKQTKNPHTHTEKKRKQKKGE